MRRKTGAGNGEIEQSLEIGPHARGRLRAVLSFVYGIYRHDGGACGVLNSAYDIHCRVCGNDPGSAFVAAHRDEVFAHHRKMTGK